MAEQQQFHPPYPAAAAAEGQPFLPHHPPPPPPPSTYYVLLPLHRVRLRRPNGCRSRCSCAVVTSVSLLAVALLLLLLWPTSPALRVVRIQLDHVRAVTNPAPYLDVSMDLRIRVRNPNFLSIRYDSLVTSVAYRGRSLGVVTSAGGEVKARGVSFVDAKLRMDGIEMLADLFFFIQDLAAGFIPFDTVTEFHGSVRIFFVDVPINGKISCAVHVNTKNQSVVHQDCYPE